MDIDVSSKFATVTNRGGRQIYCWPPLPHTGQHATDDGPLAAKEITADKRADFVKRIYLKHAQFMTVSL